MPYIGRKTQTPAKRRLSMKRNARNGTYWGSVHHTEYYSIIRCSNVKPKGLKSRQICAIYKNTPEYPSPADSLFR